MPARWPPTLLPRAAWLPPRATHTHLTPPPCSTRTLAGLGLRPRPPRLALGEELLPAAPRRLAAKQPPPQLAVSLQEGVPGRSNRGWYSYQAGPAAARGRRVPPLAIMRQCLLRAAPTKPLTFWTSLASCLAAPPVPARPPAPAVMVLNSRGARRCSRFSCRLKVASADGVSAEEAEAPARLFESSLSESSASSGWLLISCLRPLRPLESPRIGANFGEMGGVRGRGRAEHPQLLGQSGRPPSPWRSSGEAGPAGERSRLLEPKLFPGAPAGRSPAGRACCLGRWRRGSRETTLTLYRALRSLRVPRCGTLSRTLTPRHVSPHACAGPVTTGEFCALWARSWNMGYLPGGLEA